MGMSIGVLKAGLAEVEKSGCYPFKVAAVIFKGSRILSTGHNDIRSCSKVQDRYKNWRESLHAEQDCIRKASRNLKGTTMLVLRRNPSGSLQLARPCEMCWGWIRDCGIKGVYYTNSDGGITYERT